MMKTNVYLDPPAHMIRASIHSIEEIFDIHSTKRQPHPAYIDGRKVIMNKRIAVFRKYGVKCVYCGIKGSFFAVERHRKKNPKTKKKGWHRWHLSLYAKINGGVRLMTIDHVVPRSKGGSNDIENLRPACCKCNAKKGNKLRRPVVTSMKKIRSQNHNKIMNQMYVIINQSRWHLGDMLRYHFAGQTSTQTKNHLMDWLHDYLLD